MTDILKKLSTIRHRRFIILLSEKVAKGLFVGTVGVCLFRLVNRLTWLTIPVGYLAIISLFLGVCIGLIRAIRNRESLLDVAKFVDRKFDFKERVSTACENIGRVKGLKGKRVKGQKGKRVKGLKGKRGKRLRGKGVKGKIVTQLPNYPITQLPNYLITKLPNYQVSTSSNHPIEQLQITDAEQVISSIDVRSEFPYKIPSFARYIPITLVLIAVLSFIPKLYDNTSSLSKLELSPQLQLGMLQTAKELKKFDKPSNRQIHKLIEKLRGERLNVETAQNELAKLHASVRKRNTTLKNDLRKEIKRLRQQELRTELAKGQVSKLQSDSTSKAARSKLRSYMRLNELDEGLRKKIEKMLEQTEKIARLNEMSKVIQDGQKRIGLASLDQSIASKNAISVANRSGKPGNKSGTGEAVGTEIDAQKAENVESQKARKPDQESVLNGRNTLSQSSSQTKNMRLSLKFKGNQNELILESMESETTTLKDGAGDSSIKNKQKALAQYRKVYLASKQELGEAISSEDIPARYEQQVKDYFKRVAPNE